MRADRQGTANVLLIAEGCAEHVIGLRKKRDRRKTPRWEPPQRKKAATAKAETNWPIVAGFIMRDFVRDMYNANTVK
jgi:hypothetical protein